MCLDGQCIFALLEPKLKSFPSDVQCVISHPSWISEASLSALSAENSPMNLVSQGGIQSAAAKWQQAYGAKKCEISRRMVRKSAKTDGQKMSETDSPKSAKTSERGRKRSKTSENGRKKLGNGPNMVSESTVSNTELSEFFGAH